MFYAFILTHISICFRERYPIRRILLHGYTARPLQRLLDLLLVFGMLLQKSKIYWSKVFNLGALKSSSPTPTRTTVMTSSKRYSLHLLNFYFLPHSCFSTCALCIFAYIPLFIFANWPLFYPPSLSRIWLLRNSKKWQLHMWMLPLRPGGFGGGNPPPRSKPQTSSPLLFLFTKKSSMTGFTKFFFGHMFFNNFFFHSLSFLTICVFHLRWRKGLRVTLPHLKLKGIWTRFLPQGQSLYG